MAHRQWGGLFKMADGSRRCFQSFRPSHEFSSSFKKVLFMLLMEEILNSIFATKNGKFSYVT